MTERQPCCEALGAAVAAVPDPRRTLSRRRDGGIVLTIETVPATLDVGTFIVRNVPIRFCPFCGTELPEPATTPAT